MLLAFILMALFAAGIPLAAAYLVTSWVNERGPRPRTAGWKALMALLFVCVLLVLAFVMANLTLRILTS